MVRFSLSAVGVLHRVAEYEDGSYTLQIDAWNVSNPLHHSPVN